MNDAKIKVLLVDDHALLLEGLEALLGDHADISVVGTARTVSQATEAAARLHPDVVLMDFRLPDGTGAAAAVAMRSSESAPAIVFLSADDSHDSVLAAVEAGAVGYLVKSDAARDVAEAVRRAAAGEMLVPPGVLAQLISRQREKARDHAAGKVMVESLSSREMEVLKLMAGGMDNQSLADKLFISYATVRGHVRNILAKLGAHTKLEAVAKASEFGLL